MQNPWLSPFTPQIRGGLRQQINQFTDADGTILTPKKLPTRSSQEYSYIAPTV